ncbi:hypothetical protein AMJ57_05175 [Parcubacteria bacterium SG8_24]|nr:MAG: hypothetical protein AMJ57_05175 [Parcubacteria bacterium SG8_24]
MPILNPLSSAFGLDISDRSFKLIQMSKRSRSKYPYRVSAWGAIDIPEGVLERGDLKDVDQAAALLTKLLRTTRGRIKGRGVVACLPETRTFVKMIEATQDNLKEGVEKLVTTEIEQNIPLTKEDIYYDYQLVAMGENRMEPQEHQPTEEPVEETPKEDEAKKGEDAGEKEKGQEAGQEAETPPTETAEEGSEETISDNQKYYLIIAAAPRELVDSYTALLEKTGLAPIALEIEAMSITRALTPAGEHFKDPIGLLDIGATRSSLVIFDEGVLKMTVSIPLSGIEITETIAEKLQLEMENAEKLKIECGLDANRCDDKIWTTIAPLIEDITEKIRNALRFYQVGVPSGRKIEKLLLCGGGAHFREIDAVLSRKLAIKVVRGDSLINVNPSLPKGFTPNRSLAFTTAIGLGIRAANEYESYKKRF